LVDSFEDGVFFVDLSPVLDSHAVLQTLARTLGVREEAGRSIEATVAAHLHDKRLLLLLDNFEQVLDAAPTLVALMHSCPWLKALVTSREALHVRGERRYNLPPLALPDPKSYTGRTSQDPGKSRLEAILSSPAVELFVERAQDVQPSFELAEGNAVEVAEICRGLDGLPRAIELAAARIETLSPGEIRAGIDRRLKLLTRGARDLPPHQRTLRQAILWSYELLSTSDRQLLSRLAVFEGGFTSMAAKAVYASTSAGSDSVLDGLAALVSKSLVQETTNAPDQPRFRMLETIREFASEIISGSGEAEEVSESHAHYFLALAEAAEPQLRGPDVIMWLNLLQIEESNLRAALRWARNGNKLPIASRLVFALWYYWDLRGFLREGYEQAAAVTLMVRAVEENTAEYARLLFITSWLSMDGEETFRLAQESLSVARQLKSEYERDKVLSEVLRSLWFYMYQKHDHTPARQYAEEQVETCRRLGDKALLGYGLNNLGLTAEDQGDYTRARSAYTEALEIQRSIDNKSGIAGLLISIGELNRTEGDYSAARASLQESVAIWRHLGERSAGLGFVLRSLGYVSLRQGEVAAALDYFRESLRIFEGIKTRRNMASSIVGIAGCLSLQGEYTHAIWLMAAADGLLAAVKAQLEPTHQAEYDHILGALQERLDDATYDDAWAAGQVMTVEQAVAQALGNVEAM